MRDIVQNLTFKKPVDRFDWNEFSRIVEQGYLKERREKKFVQKYSFSPSSVGYGHGTCPRYWYLSFTGGDAEDTVDALGMANMMNGTAAHDRLQKIFQNTGTLVASEIEIKLSDPPVRGFIDVMIRWNDEVVVGEIKTTRSEAFVVRQATMKPSPNHLLQILIYMKATGKKRGFLFYENKNSQEFLILPVNMNEANELLLNNALDWMRDVYKAWQMKEEPKRPFRKNNKICKNCPVYETCWTLPDGKVVMPVMEVPKL